MTSATIDVCVCVRVSVCSECVCVWVCVCVLLLVNVFAVLCCEHIDVCLGCQFRYVVITMQSVLMTTSIFLFLSYLQAPRLDFLT